MDQDTIYLLIAIIGCVVGLAGWLRNAESDEKDQASDRAAIATKLDFISEDVKDTKAELRTFRTDLAETRSTASAALSSARAAHARIDAIESKED